MSEFTTDERRRDSVADSLTAEDSSRVSLDDILTDLSAKKSEEKAISAEELFRTLKVGKDGRVARKDFWSQWKRTPSRADFEKWTTPTTQQLEEWSQQPQSQESSGVKFKYNTDTLKSSDFENWRDEKDPNSSRRRASWERQSVEIKKTFDRYDEDKDGHLTESEFVKLFAFHTGNSMSIEHAKQLFKKYDKDGNCLIDYDELLTIYKEIGEDPVKANLIIEEDASDSPVQLPPGTPKEIHHVRDMSALSVASESSFPAQPIPSGRITSDSLLDGGRAVDKLKRRNTALLYKDTANRTRLKMMKGEMDKLEAENKRLTNEYKAAKKTLETLGRQTKKVQYDMKYYKAKAAELEKVAEKERKKRKEFQIKLKEAGKDNDALQAELRKLQVYSPTSPSGSKRSVSLSRKSRRPTVSRKDLSQFPEIQRDLEKATKVCSQLREQNEEIKERLSEMKLEYEATIARQLDEINELSTKLRRRRSARPNLNDDLNMVTKLFPSLYPKNRNSNLLK